MFLQKKHIKSGAIHFSYLFILLSLLFLSPSFSIAGSIPTNQLHMPMGASSPTANGDYVSASSGGLNTYYSYFIEVPPGIPRLVIDIFDADIGGAGEGTTGPRDRLRGSSWDTSATYTLIDPSGNQRRTRFDIGDSTNPAGANNAWLNFYNGTGNNVRDNFDTISYSNNDGNHNWSGSWIENDPGGSGPSSGNIQITGGELRITGNTQNRIEREVNLSATGLNLSSAYLTFSYRSSAGLNSNDCVNVYASGNGGTTYTSIGQFCGAISSTTTFFYDISPYISSNTRIRFAVSNTLERNEYYYFDNVEIHDGGPLTPGHWELRVDMGTNDDINGFAIRAHDGDPSSSGTELNIYAHSFLEIGVHSDTANKIYNLYPFITSGCIADSNDFDADSSGSFTFTSRTGSFTTSSSSISGNNVWLNTPFSGWTNDTWSADYGIWSLNFNVIRYDPSSGNYVTFYAGNFSAANPPPTSQPESNTFRIYMPTDAGTAPVKPILTQTLSHVSGPNPPSVGSTSRLKVQITFFNPTPFPVSFSGAGNMVRANVPGTGVVYAGNAVASQGTITSQPSIGGTGNIVWNPGTISAGSFADLIYEINVTPTLSGQRIPVTGTPSLNGTIAVYIDETGNTTQARATYTFGPLCELAVTEGASSLPTLASISSFNAFIKDNRVLLKWDTVSEIGTAGFNIYRKDNESNTYLRINERLLPGLISSPQGGTYTYIDLSALPGNSYTYLIEEIEQRGNKRINGPFTVTAEHNYYEKISGSYNKTPHKLSDIKKTRLETIEKEKAKIESIAGQTSLNTKIKISINETGLFYIPNSKIAELLGTTPQKISTFIKKKMLKLTNNGIEVAFTPSPKNSGIYFFGEANSGIYSNENIYWLEYNSGKQMEIVKGKKLKQATGIQTFTEIYTAEENKIPAEALFTNPDSDFWFWDFLVADDAQDGIKIMNFNLDFPANSGTVNFTANMFGGTNTSHHAIISVNGVEIGEAKWDGLKPHQIKVDFNSSILHDGENIVEVKGILDNAVPYSIFYVDSFHIIYQSYYKARNNQRIVRGNNNPVVTIEGFEKNDIKVFDITDRLNPKIINNFTIFKNGANYSVSFAGGPGENTYLALTTSALKSPSSVFSDSPSNLKNTSNSADYLIITVQQLLNETSQLSSYRQGKGLQTMIVLQDDIMDEFNYGNYSPKAIREFLKYAYNNWAKYPKFVVISGEGNDDYKNYQSLGGNLIPPIMIGSPDGLFPSDNYFADINDDHIPEMAVGRLPAGTSGELQALITKIIAYENSSGNVWKNNIILFADNPDKGGDFTADSNSLAAVIPSEYSVQKIYLSEHSVEDTRQMLLSDINNGAVLLNYLGHASMDRLTQEGILTLDDVVSLNNNEKLPVITAMTCVMGNYSIAGFDSLGVRMLLRQNGGVSAVFSPTGMSINSHALALGKSFYQSYFEKHGQTLGEIVLQALNKSKEQGVSGYMLDIYNILGDPALQIK